MTREEEYYKLFIEVGDAAHIPKQNPFAFPMWQCIASSISPLVKNDIKFILTYDFVKFCEKHFIDIDTERVKAQSFKLEDRGLSV